MPILSSDGLVTVSGRYNHSSPSAYDCLYTQGRTGYYSFKPLADVSCNYRKLIAQGNVRVAIKRDLTNSRVVYDDCC